MIHQIYNQRQQEHTKLFSPNKPRFFDHPHSEIKTKLQINKLELGKCRVTLPPQINNHNTFYQPKVKLIENTFPNKFNSTAYLGLNKNYSSLKIKLKSSSNTLIKNSKSKVQ